MLDNKICKYKQIIITTFRRCLCRSSAENLPENNRLKSHYTEQYNDRSLNFVQTAEENLKAQFENKSGEFDSSKHSEIEKNIMTGKWNITTL